MDAWPIPTQWKKYKVDEYVCRPTKLRIFHGILMFMMVLLFAWFMIYFMALASYQQTYIGIDNLSITDSTWTCSSIGTRSTDQYNFASITDNISILNNSRYSIRFIHYDIRETRYSAFARHYSYWREYSDINWRPAEHSPLYQYDYYVDHPVTMRYSIDRGNAQNADECPALYGTICQQQTQEIQTYFFYNIYIILNLSYYADQIITMVENYHKWMNTTYDSQQLWLYRHNYNTSEDDRIASLYDYPLIKDRFNWTQLFTSLSDYPPQYWWFARTDGGIIESVWDLCKDKFVDIGNQSFFISIPLGFHKGPPFRVNINLHDHAGIVQCLYNDSKYGLLVTDIQDTFGENHIIPTPMNDAGILLKLPNDTMNYSNALTTIAQGEAIDIRIIDKHKTIMDTSDAIDIWQHEICKEMVSEYCEYVDVPPYYCTKTEIKTWLEGVSLSLSPTSLIYTAFVMCFAYVMKCWEWLKCFNSSGSDKDEKGIALLTMNSNDVDHLERIQILELQLEQMVQQNRQMAAQMDEVKAQLAGANKP